jgi:hypothetical protein
MVEHVPKKAPGNCDDQLGLGTNGMKAIKVCDPSFRCISCETKALKITTVDKVK